MTDGTHEIEPKSKTIYCSFCGKSEHEVEHVVAGNDVFICNICIERCRDIIGMKRIEEEND